MTTVLPVYLVVDASGSMVEGIDAVNQGLADLIDSLTTNPAVADAIRIGVVQFSSEAREVLPLTGLHRIDAMPMLEAHGTTNYGTAFALLRQLIVRDVAELRNSGLQVFRPVAFFITDGLPTDSSWSAALQDLQESGFRERPTIIAIGFGSADPGILREIGNGEGGAAFVISESVNVRGAVVSIYSVLDSMLASIVRSSVSKSGPSLPIHLPDTWIDLSSIPELP